MRMPLIVVVLLSTSVVRAQSGGGPVDLQLFRPAMDSKGYITLNASQVLGHLDISFGFVFNWARRPLSLASDRYGTTWRDSNLDAIPSRFDIDNMATGNLLFAIGLFKHLELGIDFPLTFWNGDTDPPPAQDDDGGVGDQGPGDLGVRLKARILNTSRYPVGLGLMLSASFPTGNNEAFLGSGRFTIAPSIIVDRELFDGRLSLAVNVGARFRTGTDSWTDMGLCQLQTNLTQKSECGTGTEIETAHHLTYGIGASLAIVKGRFDFVAEIVGQTGLSGFADPDKLNSAAEFLGGFKLYLARNSYFAFGAGRGLRGQTDNHQYGSPDVRLFAAFIFEPSIGDRDGDGIKDDVDKCPDDPEDQDDFEDEDGCPDLDNDRDGILDKDDRCPNEPEDKDGFEDDDGCPDPDNDKDRILDVDDKCPNEPETYNGYQDEDGCPDKGRVVVHKGRIEILDKIYFETDKAIIKPVSYPILDAIGATLKGNPQILLIEIRGHADERGADAYNMRLTDDRAHAVMKYLTDKSVEGSRLKAKGYGETRPVDKNHNEEAWSKNRRVEFVILKRSE